MLYSMLTTESKREVSPKPLMLSKCLNIALVYAFNSGISGCAVVALVASQGVDVFGCQQTSLSRERRARIDGKFRLS